MDSTAEENKYDSILEGYGEWLNDALYAFKAEEDTILFLGENRWLIASNLDPGDLFVISIQRATLSA